MSALPQFDLQAWDRFDPDRTIERLPALTADAEVPAVAAPSTEVTPPSDEEPDMATTVELVPEVSAGDILEARPAPREREPLLVPAPASVPIDLDRLLAQARAETSRSTAFARPRLPEPRPNLVSFTDEPTPPPTTLFAELSAPVVSARTKRGPLGWLLAAASLAAVVAVTVVATHPSAASSAPAQAAAQPVAAAASVNAGTVANLKSAAESIPEASVQNLPQVESGTISLAAVAAAHRLFVDGKLVANGSALVTCGSHVVQVGSRGLRRRIDVPCGQDIVVAN